MKTRQKHKTRFVAFVASSIDGKISLTNKTSPDWTSKEDWRFFQNSLKKFDAVLVGKNTFLAEAERISKRRAFVLTSKVKRPKTIDSVTFLNPKYTDLKDVLSEFGSVAVLGGGAVYQYMLDHGLLDEIFVTIEPIILGRGIEMFTKGKSTYGAKLILVKKLNKTGTLLLKYKLKK